MDSSRVRVDLDCHTGFVPVCVLNQQGHALVLGRCGNSGQHIVQPTRPIGTVQPAAIEACNGAADLAEKLFRPSGWSVDLTPSGCVQHMKGSPDKTDSSDARWFADPTRVAYRPKV